MKYILLIALCLSACAGPDGGETNINIADQGATAGDPITETNTEANSGCADSEDQCGADF